MFQPDGLVAWNCPDVYYHLHRIVVGAQSWPRFPEFDLWRNYPNGAYSIWSPLFDMVPAAIAALTSVPPLLVGVLWPAVLGALAILPLLDILRRLQGDTAWLGVALYIVLPGSVSFAILGRADHHVGEVVTQLWVYALTLRCVQTLEHGAAPTTRQASVLGIAIALSLLMWRGAVVYLTVPAAVGLLMVATTQQASTRKAAARVFIVALCVGAGLTLPYAALNVMRGRPAFAAYHLSLLQPAMLLAWALLFPVAQQIGQTGLQLRPLLRVNVMLPMLGVALLFGLGAHGFLAGTAFLTRVGDPWAANITESQPAWAGGIPTYFVIEELGFTPLLLVFLIVIHLVVVLRSRPPSPTAVFVLLSAACATALVFMQVRFVYYAAPVAVAVPGALWCALRGRKLTQAAAVLLAFAALWPVTRFWSPVFDSDPQTQMRPLEMEPWLVRMMTELRVSTPSAGDVYQPGVRPAYCVLAPWTLGNFIQTMAHRAVLASSGGPHETAAYDDTVLFSSHFTQESEAVERMVKRGCRYAITERVAADSEPEGSAEKLFARRLHLHDGSDWQTNSGSGQFRWRFESHDAPGQPSAQYKVFELVPGALLRFPAARASWLQTEVHDAYRRFVYQRRLQPAADGFVAARVSQPGTYRVVDGNGTVAGAVSVSEKAVMRGHTLSFAASPESERALH
ncbi:MAG TPA: hypothetical protein VF331_01460 [Polyangiales bacterium]